MSRFLVWCFCLCGVFHTAFAQTEAASFPVSRLEETARLAAMGGHSAALRADDSGSFFANPALLGLESRNQLSFTYLNHVAGINSGTVAYARGLDSLTVIAGGIRYLSFGSLDRRDDTGEKSGTFGASDIDVALGASRALNSSFRYGANIHLLLNSLDGESASALTIDAGASWVNESGNISAGAVIRHLGVGLSRIGTKAPKLPTDVRLGATARLSHVPLLFSLSLYRLNELGEAPDDLSSVQQFMYHVILGSEFQFSRNFQLRIGYNFRKHDELGIKDRLDFAGVSTGFGLRISRIAIDYAFNSWSSLGGLHRFTLRTSL